MVAKITFKQQKFYQYGSVLIRPKLPQSWFVPTSGTRHLLLPCC